VKKVLILITDDYPAGGLQRSAMALCECLAKGGYEPLIYCMRLVPGGLAETYPYVRLVSPVGQSKWLNWLSFFKNLRALLVREQWTAAIGFGVAAASMIALTGYRLPKLLLIGAERTFPPAATAKPIFKILRKWAFPRLSFVVCQTGQSKRWFEQALAIPSSRLVVIPNVVREPSPGWTPPQFASEEGFTPLFVAVGRLAEEKQFDLALQIFGRVIHQWPTARLMIIGEGPLRQELLDLRAALGLEKQVEFRPPTPDLAAVWREAYAMLFTSRYEGFPNVLAEAMAHGVPAVAFDCPTGPADLIADSQNGFLIPPGDVEGAAGRCLELLADPSARDRMGSQAMEVSRTFSFDKVAHLWNSLMTRSPEATTVARATNSR
jgi:glycosyltransferase involved in cell wall biosynthesis